MSGPNVDRTCSIAHPFRAAAAFGRSRAAPRRRRPMAPILRSRRQDPNADIIYAILHSSLYSLALQATRSPCALGKINYGLADLAVDRGGDQRRGTRWRALFNSPCRLRRLVFLSLVTGFIYAQACWPAGSRTAWAEATSRPQLATKCRLPHAQSKMAITPTGNCAKYRAAFIPTGHGTQPRPLVCSRS